MCLYGHKEFLFLACEKHLNIKTTILHLVKLEEHAAAYKELSSGVAELKTRLL